MSTVYDVVVIGAGHAGCEAALAAARLGAEVLLLTTNCDHIAQMSCNPAVGGIAKGQLVREIDALGGAQGIVAEHAAIQFRMLNRTKGPAVWSPRTQCDKVIYQRAMKLLLENTPHLRIQQSEAVNFDVAGGRITGVVNHYGEHFPCRSVVITTGTFLRGMLHYGLQHYPGGRAGDFPANALSTALENTLKLKLGRLKTGTPPRILSKSIDFGALEQQPSEQGEEKFSFWSTAEQPELPHAQKRDMPCFMLYTTDETAQIVRDNLHLSPMVRGIIKGIGTRYCPSFEDKIRRFPQHPHHLLYLEPEGAETGEYYVNGFSTSLPVEVQYQMVHSLPGLHDAIISRFAYAIEYDYLPPEQLRRSLQNKFWPNLFTAGQINGTSGYEEAAAQGLAAGLNAARHAAGLDPVEFSRDSSYLGVMLDDLATKEIVEPYRLFTSRAEYRLTLRQENADLRLSERAHELGLLPEGKYREFTRWRDRFTAALGVCRERRYRGATLLTMLKTVAPDSPDDTPLPFPAELLPELDREDHRLRRALLIEAHYDGYLQREEVQIRRMSGLDRILIPGDFDYDALPGLCSEARQKLLRIRPTSLGQAGRIDGVTAADVALLQVALHRKKGGAK